MNLFEIWYVSMAVDPLSQRATGYDVISQRRVGDAWLTQRRTLSGDFT